MSLHDSPSKSPLLPTPPLNYSELLQSSWAVIQPQLLIIAGLSLVFVMGYSGVCALPFLGWPLANLLMVGYIACMLRVRKGQAFDFEDFLWGFQNFNRFINVLLLNVLCAIVWVAGTICFVIPGIYLFVALFLATIFLVRDDVDAIEAMRRSYYATKENWWFVCGLVLMIGILNFAGFLSMLVGVLITAPLTIMVAIFAAEGLSGPTAEIPSFTFKSAPTPSPSSIQVNPN